MEYDAWVLRQQIPHQHNIECPLSCAISQQNFIWYDTVLVPALFDALHSLQTNDSFAVSSFTSVAAAAAVVVIVFLFSVVCADRFSWKCIARNYYECEMDSELWVASCPIRFGRFYFYLFTILLRCLAEWMSSHKTVCKIQNSFNAIFPSGHRTVMNVRFAVGDQTT